MRFAYADPPYIGQARKHYADDPECAEVDHGALIAELETYDAWALSLSVPSLRVVLPLTPDDSRICAWVKPFCSFKPGVRLAYAWEPIILKGWRKGCREDPTVRDWVSACIALQQGVHGAKPYDFCLWLFRAIGLEATDEFYDLFPGSGAVTRAWEAWCRQGVLRREVGATHPLTLHPCMAAAGMAALPGVGDGAGLGDTPREPHRSGGM